MNSTAAAQNSTHEVSPLLMAAGFTGPPRYGSPTRRTGISPARPDIGS